jgi:hypothetical protein
MFENKVQRAYLAWVARLDTPEKWIAQIKISAPELQAELLSGVDAPSLGISEREFLETLTYLEPHIRADPAATAYWALRSDFELIERQRRSEQPKMHGPPDIRP